MDHQRQLSKGNSSGVFRTLGSSLLMVTLVVFTHVSCSQNKEPQLTSNGAESQGPGTGSQSVTPPVRDAEVTVAELKSALDKQEDIFLLDVRSGAEFDAGHIAEVDKLIPHTTFLANEVDFPVEKTQYIYCICRSGHRSGYVTKWLRENGYSHAYNVIGGMNAWASSGYPVAP